MKRQLTIAAALACLAAGPTAHAAAPPVGFACSKPIIAVWEIPALSRYRISDDERVFQVKIYLDAEQQGDSIGVGPKHPGICRIILPIGADFTQLITWHEARVPDTNHRVYQSLQVRQAGGPGSNRDWLMISPKPMAASGEATIEFHLLFNYPDPGN